MLTSSEDREDMLAAFDAGAAGYLTKGARYTESKAAIRGGTPEAGPKAIPGFGWRVNVFQAPGGI